MRCACYLPVALLVLAALGGEVRAQAATTITYTETFTDFPNPERGFYLQPDASATVTLPLLQGYRAQHPGMSLIRRIFRMATYRSSDLDGVFMNRVTAELDAVRQAGMKAVVRFAYTTESGDTGDLEAPPALVARHIHQLRPVLLTNADVIATVEAGFIGRYGEWWESTYFGSNGVPNYALRRPVMDSLMLVLPATRTVLVRTPRYKTNLLGVTTPLPASEAHTGTPRARMGYHNDCFLVGSDDVGTYESVAERTFVKLETQFVPMGGETCDVMAPTRFDCATAPGEMSDYHFTYLNREFYAGAITTWTAGGCLAAISRNLGYRLVPRTGTYTTAVQPGGTFHFELQLDNVGYAAPINPRRVGVVLRRQGMTSLAATYVVTLPETVEVRDWGHGMRTLTFELGIPQAGMDPGVYDLYLHLPDPSPGLSGRTAYAIRLAATLGGTDVWDATSGFNRLGAITVSGTATEPPYTGTLWFQQGVRTAAEDGPAAGGALALSAPRPSPAGGAVRLDVTARTAQRVRVEAFDALGRRVAVLFEGAVAAGAVQPVVLDGSALPAGVYVVRAVGDGGAAVQRVMLVR